MSAEMSVALSPPNPPGTCGACSPRCPGSVEYVAQIAYCYCRETGDESWCGTCDNPDRHDIPLCRVHAAEIRSWACLVRIEDAP